MNQASLDERLLQIDEGLGALNTTWEQWDQEMAKVQKDLEAGGMDWFDALEEVHRRYVEIIKRGDSPVDFDQLGALLDDLCAIYLEVDAQERAGIRALFDNKQRVLKHLHSYTAGRAASRLESTGDVKWLRLGLAAASISDRRVDYRDLLICLGELWLAAESVGIAPARYFSAVARISNPEPRYGDRSTQDLLRGFRRSGHLRSIKRKAKRSSSDPLDR
jgi:hypothetical protein